jgi:hypothetical protein
MLNRCLMLAAIGAAALAWTVADAGAAGVGHRCGGPLGITCGRGLWCDPTPGTCTPGGRGKCVRVAFACDQLWMPVCGCNGVTYTNDCWRIMSKEAKRRNGRC